MKKHTPEALPQSAIDAAKMTPAEFQKINAGMKDSVNAGQAATAAHVAKAAGARRGAPPSNTGGKYQKLVVDGKPKLVMERTHYASKVCFVDWLNFTCHEDTFQILSGAVSDQEIILAVSQKCADLFGFGITLKRDKGANFYHTSYTLGDGYGLVCYGGQRNTVLVMLNGEGCAAAKPGWERRVSDFLQSAQNGRITRIDLAHDDYLGERFTPESVEDAFDNGLFNNGGRNPDIELRGNWKNPNGKGRTVNIGQRTNGKFCRCYEKGKQLGDELSPWMRVEVEFKSVDRVIPFEILKFPQEYFAAAYPLLRHFSVDLQRIDTIKKTTVLSYNHCKKWLKRQAGPAIHFLYQIEQDPQKVLDLIMREGKVPKGCLPPSHEFVGPQIHHEKPDYFPASMSFINEEY